ncbi:MAG: metallophosphoesterase [Bacteroides sp.]|nr:metallophosphoesterase [Bacteroides sp.]
MTNKLLFLILFTVCFTSCDMFEVHPYDVHITGERGLTEKNINLIENKMAGKKTFRFAMISDTQRWYDDTQDVVKAINARGDVDFVIHGGDQSNFGATKEFMWMRDIFGKFQMPYVCLLGNHDCLGTGKDAYHAIYGNANFAFTAGNVRFICLNTNALEYNYSEPVPDFNFMENELKNLSPEVEKTVFAMHVKPFEMIFNNNVAKIFQVYVNMFPNVQFCLYGHEHQLTVDDLFGDGVLYYQCPCIDKRTYLLFTIKEDGSYDYEAIKF